MQIAQDTEGKKRIQDILQDTLQWAQVKLREGSGDESEHLDFLRGRVEVLEGFSWPRDAKDTQAETLAKIDREMSASCKLAHDDLWYSREEGIYEGLLVLRDSIVKEDAY